MLLRRKKTQIIQALEAFPAVVLIGPRQCGKTTLAKTLSTRYYDLEIESERLRLDLDWHKLCDTNELIVLDEAQTFAEIFPRLRAAIDLRRKVFGPFLILASVAPALMQDVAESLAGRAALLELTPLSLGEVPYSETRALWRFGGFPDGGVLDAARYPLWQESYLQLIIQRDLPNLGLPAKPILTERMLKMIAALHGQEWNASKLGASLGINYQTVNSYLEYLHGAFLTSALVPFEVNVKKRLVKRPKVYLRDSGLLHALLGVGRGDDILSKPWVGASWEGFVIEQILAALDCSQGTPTPYFVRTSSGEEIDLVLQYRGQLWAFEIKLTGEPTREHAKALRTLAPALGADRRILVHGGVLYVKNERSEGSEGYDVMPLERCIQELSMR